MSAANRKDTQLSDKFANASGQKTSQNQSRKTTPFQDACVAVLIMRETLLIALGLKTGAGK